ncbi:hypothetical protein GCWU000324_02762 [Kingella oralis ATCC 51147]|uniref:Uncharacterized protein n=1 Tax=Kingella oralis ATCC 51147 TaxID=629741 RepID=C4GM30_9NEIS|nr:hypothetical protein GCWU000324_02762 [Kingella oralis ATCC 51147]
MVDCRCLTCRKARHFKQIRVGIQVSGSLKTANKKTASALKQMPFV